ncbi:hypothetical protein PRIPAC_75974 [Pristionchus pacificus]|uniref:Uncharacterized protein n=1 Tax=Pristionchus pacificus TaxID=54126 RepID=A0A454Y5S7_PRIPA|nr:hypothetical protein PRIPAC_75974 [Pristionchus pacificus]|eukprot:PDM83736.1 hypothetical protein PRIPAC_30223 [Pristionchus pacificus]
MSEKVQTVDSTNGEETTGQRLNWRLHWKKRRCVNLRIREKKRRRNMHGFRFPAGPNDDEESYKD